MSAKENLMNIALERFAQEGYENTGVAAIVEAAQVTKPTLYHHFGNKEGLLTAIIDQHGYALKRIFEKKLVYNGDVNSAMRDLVNTYAAFAKENPLFFHLYKQLYQSPLNSQSKRLITPFYEGICMEVKHFFEQVSAHHSNLKGKEQWMTFSFLGLMDTYVTYYLEKKELDHMDEKIGGDIAQQFLYGIF